MLIHSPPFLNDCGSPLLERVTGVWMGWYGCNDVVAILGSSGKLSRVVECAVCLLPQRGKGATSKENTLNTRTHTHT